MLSNSNLLRLPCRLAIRLAYFRAMGGTVLTLVVLCTFIFTLNVQAQILTFDFSGLSGNEGTAVSNSNDPNANSSTISRGSGLTASNNGNRFNATSWATSNIGNAVTGNDYMEFTLSPTSGFQLDISSIEVNIQRSGTGPREVALRSSVDGFTSNLGGSQTITDNTSIQIKTFSFSQTSASSITYRFYMWAESTGGSGGFEGSGNDIIVNGTVTSTSGPDPEPTNYPTLFSCATVSSDQIDLSWTDAVGAQLPDGYLIKWSDISYAAITNPTDGSDSNGANSLTENQGTQSASVTGLDPNTQYFFKIWSYTNSGSNIDYKTSAGILQTDCTTDNGPCFEESFSGITGTGSAGSYLTRNWTGDEGIAMTATDTRIDEPINGTAATIRNGSFTVNAVSNGIETLTLTTQRKFGGGSGDLDILVNGLPVGTIPYSGSVQTTTITGINTGGTFDLVIENNGSDRVAIDDLNWTCFSGCTPTHTIISFLPTSGPPGTLVTISGSGFTGATATSLSGINATSITVIDDNSIIAEIPGNATSGSIGVTVAGCETQSGQNFTLLVDDGDCGASGSGGSFASDLFISEVYDANSGSLSYVEIFNGTNATVNLATDNYVIRIRTGTSTDSDYSMTGNLASGDTYILRLGSSSSTCSNFSPDQDLPLAPGFNGDDRIYLRKNNADLDYAPNPNHPDAGGSGGSQPGFSQSRNGSVTSPSTTYMAADWTIGANEVCDDLGIAPFVPNGSDVTINTQPLDVDCSALTFSVTATADPIFNPTNPYVWRYNEPGTDTWELVSSLNGVNGLVVTGSGTSSITITGNTSNLLDYQFYVDITADGTPDCTRSSNAARYTFETRPFYRTKSSGNWTDVTNWEMSLSEFGTYDDACQYPTEVGSSKVNILTGDSIHIDALSLTMDEMNINSNGVLSIGEDGELTFNNGNSGTADFVINGLYYDMATSGNGIEFNTAATWEISPSATIIKTNNSSVSRYRDNYESGIANIPATANWIYRREGNNDVSVASTGMFYPNLTFENNFGPTYDPTDVFNFFQGSSSAPVIKGDLNIGGSGTEGYVVRTNNTNASPILIQGDLIIQSQSTFTNEDLIGSDDGTGIEVQGDLTIGGALQLQNGAAGRGQLILSGTGDQIGLGDGFSVLVNDFEINKPSGAFFTEFSLIIAEEARFISGIYEVDDAASNPADVEFSIGSSATGMSNASFIDGRVDKFGSSDFTFPIGDTNADGVALYEPARIFALTGTGGFSARYFAEAHPNAGLYYDGESNNPDDYQEISNCDFWNIDQVTGFTANARIGLTYTNPNNLDGDLTNDNCNSVTDPSSVFIARWNAVASDWEQPISEGSTTGASESTSDGVLNPGLGGYGDFTLTSNNPNFNVLPITLLSFRAEAKEQRVITNWITASEINNDFFTIERSKDGNQWEIVTELDGAGDSHTELSYSAIDDRPYSGISYYRLLQTDYDGTSTVSEPQAVEIRTSGEFSLDRVYHAQEGLNIIFQATDPFVTIEIFDLLGKRVHTESLENSGNGFGTVFPDLSQGAYLIRLSNGHEMATEKFVW